MDQIGEYYGAMMSSFWSNKYWLPTYLTWEDLQNQRDDVTGEIIPGTTRHPEPRELWLIFPVAVFILLLRQLVERFIMKPMAIRMGLREMRHTYPEPIPELDRYFRHNRRPTGKQTKQLSDQLNMDERRIQRWFRIKRNLRKSSAMAKFCEGGWKFCYHLSAFCYGLYVLHDEYFFSDMSKLIDMELYPHAHIKQKFHTYYVATMGFWLSLGMSLLTDVRRSDFYMMAVHHVATCMLMWLSWSINFVPIGMVVLFLHDGSDFLLEMAKCLKFAKRQRMAEYVFVVFVLSWVYFRLYMYPRYVVFPGVEVYVDVYQEYGHCPAGLVITTCLVLLFILHCVWSSPIFKAVFSVACGEDAQDDRSDSEAEMSSDEQDRAPVANGHNNHNHHQDHLNHNHIAENGYHADKNGNQNCYIDKTNKKTC